MSGIKAFAREHSLTSYFVLVFVVSWGALLFLLGPDAVFGGWSESTKLGFVTVALGDQLDVLQELRGRHPVRHHPRHQDPQERARRLGLGTEDCHREQQDPSLSRDDAGYVRAGRLTSARDMSQEI